MKLLATAWKAAKAAAFAAATAGVVGAGRYFAGRRPFGDQPDNARWRYAATKNLTNHPAELLRPALWRIGVPRIVAVGIPAWIIFILAPLAWLFDLWLTPRQWVEVAGLYELVLLCAAAIWGADRWYRLWVRRRIDSRAIAPAAKALKAAIEFKGPWHRLRSRFEFPDDWELDLASIPSDQVIKVKPVCIYFEPGEVDGEGRKARIVALLGAVWRMPHPRTQWNLYTTTGDKPHLLMWPAILPPAEVTFAMLKPHMDKAPPDEPVMGLDAHLEAVSLDLTTGNPHMLISAATNDGKSELFKVRGCQRLRQGIPQIIIDPRIDSHAWAYGLPGVYYATDIEDAHRVLRAAGAGLQRRLEGPRGEDNRLPDYPEVDIIIEEGNEVADDQVKLWTRIRSQHPGQGLPLESPSITALQKGHTKGRRPGVRMVMIAQRGSAHIYGGNGGDIRENVNEKWLRMPTDQTEKMLLGRGARIKWPSNQPGLWMRALRHDHTFTQGGLFTDQEARDYAMELGGPQRAQRVLEEFLDWGSIEPGDPLPDDLEEVHDGTDEEMTLTEARRLLPGPEISHALLLKFFSADGVNRQPEAVLAVRPEPINPDAGSGVARRYIKAQLDVWKIALDKSKGILSDPIVPGVVYGLVCRDPDDPAKVGIHYVGQSSRENGMEKREAEHRRDPNKEEWARYIIKAVPLWEGRCTDRQRLAMERQWIAKLEPRYNGRRRTVSSEAVSAALEHSGAR